tara:strand:+ start:2867 stop:3676 length:810 start_codon:yes stop_codon:yes gene_type:complete
MKIISDKNKLTKIVYNETNLGFVPTMGTIHNGHISLIKRCKNECKKIIVSIYINKPQFNRKSDFKKYPRNLRSDISKLKKLKVDILYLPITRQIYSNGPDKKIKINSFEKKLCGQNRPGHFKAVVDIINRFIKIIYPKKIYLGNKDMQQLILIKDFVKENYPKIKIIGCKTIREKNGVALSSRNYLLSLKEKKVASMVYNILKNKKNMLIKNKISFDKIKKIITKIGVNKIDYIKVLDINKIIKPYKKEKRFKIFIAYNLRSTRLIDNF